MHEAQIAELSKKHFQTLNELNEQLEQTKRVLRGLLSRRGCFPSHVSNRFDTPAEQAVRGEKQAGPGERVQRDAN